MVADVRILGAHIVFCHVPEILKAALPRGTSSRMGCRELLVLDRVELFSGRVQFLRCARTQRRRMGHEGTWNTHPGRVPGAEPD